MLKPMEIITHTADRLELRARPLFLWLCAAFLFVAGAAVWGYRLPTAALTCSRPQGEPLVCEKQLSLLGLTLSREELPDLHWVWLSRHSADGQEIYRVMFYTADGAVPLTAWHSAGLAPKQAVHHRIKSFLFDESQTELHLLYREQARNLVGWMALSAVGVLLFLFAPSITITLDKGKGRLSICHRSLLHSRTAAYSLGDVTAVAQASPNYTPVEGAALVLSSGALIQLRHPYYTFTLPTASAVQALVLTLTDFLQIPVA